MVGKLKFSEDWEHYLKREKKQFFHFLSASVIVFIAVMLLTLAPISYLSIASAFRFILPPLCVVCGAICAFFALFTLHKALIFKLSTKKLTDSDAQNLYGRIKSKRLIVRFLYAILFIDIVALILAVIGYSPSNPLPTLFCVAAGMPLLASVSVLLISQIISKKCLEVQFADVISTNTNEGGSKGNMGENLNTGTEGCSPYDIAQAVNQQLEGNNTASPNI